MKIKLALLLALSVGAFGKLAVAQTSGQSLQRAQAQYAVYHPDQSKATVQQVASNRWHDRDDRWRWRERRYPNTTANSNWNNGYWGNGNYRNGGWYGNTANNSRYAQRGDYDRNGDFHPFGSNGYYDRNGNWHNGGGWWR